MNFDLLFSFITASVLLAIMPGPDIIYVMMQSISKGTKYGVITALGLISGVIIHTSLIAFGVSKIIRDNEKIFFGIKLFGALYLFYLAYKTYQSNDKIELSSGISENKSLIQLYKKGFIMNVLNPKVSLFFLAFFPGFIDFSKNTSVQQIFILGFIFMIVGFIVFSLIAIFASKATEFIRHNNKFESNLKHFQIIVFIGIGIFILW